MKKKEAGLRVLMKEPLYPEELMDRMGYGSMSAAYSLIRDLRQTHDIPMIKGKYVVRGPLPKFHKPTIPRQGTISDRILVALEQGPLKTSTLNELIGSRIYYVLNRMMKKGLVAKMGGGVWALKKQNPDLISEPQDSEPEELNTQDSEPQDSEPEELNTQDSEPEDTQDSEPEDTQEPRSPEDAEESMMEQDTVSENSIFFIDEDNLRRAKTVLNEEKLDKLVSEIDECNRAFQIFFRGER